MSIVNAGAKAPVPTPLFLEQLKRLSAVELRFVAEALHDGAQLAAHEAHAYPEDAKGGHDRHVVLQELFNRLLSDVNSRMGHMAAAE